MGRAPASVSDAYSSAEVSGRSSDTDLSSTDSDPGARVTLEPVAGSVPEAEAEMAPSALRTVTSGEHLDPEPAPPSASLAEISRLYRQFNPEKLVDVPTLVEKYGEDKLLGMVQNKYKEPDADTSVPAPDAPKVERPPSGS